MLRHASQRRGRVVDERLDRFVAANRVQYVTVLRPAEPHGDGGTRLFGSGSRPVGSAAHEDTTMHRPDHFRVEDVAQMHALMRARPFAALVSSTPAGLNGTPPADGAEG